MNMIGIPIDVTDEQPASQDQIENLYKIFQSEQALEEGQTVMWKPGMKNRTFPRYGEPAILHKIGDWPHTLEHEKDPGSNMHWDAYTAVLACASDGFFLTTIDLRRIMPFNLNAAKEMRNMAAADAKRMEKKQQEKVAEYMKGLAKGMPPGFPGMFPGMGGPE